MTLRTILFSLLMSPFLCVYSQWDQVEVPNGRLKKSCYSKSGNVIYGTGGANIDTIIYRSADGGYQFDVKPFRPSTDSMAVTHIEALNDSIVLMLVTKISIYNSRDMLMLSTDYGKTWKEKIVSNGTDSMKRPSLLYFFDSLNGIIIDHYNNKKKCIDIWQTNTAGETWTPVSCDNIPYKGSLSGKMPAFKDINTVYFSNGKSLLIGRNFGTNWELRPSNLTQNGGSVSVMSFKDSLFAIGRYSPKDFNFNNFAKTTDGGRSWDTLFTSPDKNFSHNAYYIPPATTADSGFWMIYTVGEWGAYISFDNCKTYKVLDAEFHYDLTFKNTKNFISSIYPKSDGTNLLVFNGKTNVAITNVSQVMPALFPNPASNEFHITQALGADYRIYSADGKLHLYGNTLSNDHVINTESLPNGIYYLTTANTPETALKLVIIK